MVLHNGNWVLDVDLNGGRIRQLSFGLEPVFGTFQRIDGKTGNTHICAPAFDNEGFGAGLPFHGYARTLMWDTVEQDVKSLTIRARTAPTPDYNASLRLEQKFDLEDRFAHSVTVTNEGKEGVPVDIGIHYYWNTPHGWEDVTVNGDRVGNGIMTNGRVSLMGVNRIVFPHAAYELTCAGLSTGVLWTSFKTAPEGKKEFSRDFCCIEPVVRWPGFFGTPESILSPGASVSVSVALRKVV